MRLVEINNQLHTVHVSFSETSSIRNMSGNAKFRDLNSSKLFRVILACLILVPTIAATAREHPSASAVEHDRAGPRDVDWFVHLLSVCISILVKPMVPAERALHR